MMAQDAEGCRLWPGHGLCLLVFFHPACLVFSVHVTTASDIPFPLPALRRDRYSELACGLYLSVSVSPRLSLEPRFALGFPSALFRFCFIVGLLPRFHAHRYRWTMYEPGLFACVLRPDLCLWLPADLRQIQSSAIRIRQTSRWAS